MEDEQIISLFWARDERAIEELAHRHGGLCRAMALRMLGSFQDAEECLSDALMAAWNSIPPRRPEKLSAYLARLTRNQALKRRRDSERLKRGGGELNLAYEELDECLPDPESTEQCWEQRELSAALERFLRGLPAAERRLFLRRYWGCESLRELAAANGWSESKVKSMLFRTRKKLRDYLIKEGFACECGFPDAGHE